MKEEDENPITQRKIQQSTVKEEEETQNSKQNPKKVTGKEEEEVEEMWEEYLFLF